MINWQDPHFCVPYVTQSSAPQSVFTGVIDENVPHHAPCQSYINVSQWTQAKTT